jgi:RNA polymerase sigma-70 factor (ECF subfamily)
MEGGGEARADRDLSAALDAARGGDSQALGTIYTALAPAVRGYLHGQGASDPDDLLGEVFVGVARGIAELDGDAEALRRWVFTIAHRRLVDDRRRRRVRDGGAPADESTVPDIADAATERVDAGAVRQALDGLTDEQREVLLLRIVADLPVRDVARITGRTEGAVKALTRRALAALARNLPSGAAL